MVFLKEMICPRCGKLKLYKRQDVLDGKPCTECQVSVEEARRDLWLHEQKSKQITERLGFIESWLYDHINRSDPHSVLDLVKSIIPELLSPEVLDIIMYGYYADEFDEHEE